MEQPCVTYFPKNYGSPENTLFRYLLQPPATTRGFIFLLKLMLVHLLYLLYSSLLYKNNTAKEGRWGWNDQWGIWDPVKSIFFFWSNSIHLILINCNWILNLIHIHIIAKVKVCHYNMGLLNTSLTCITRDADSSVFSSKFKMLILAEGCFFRK